MSDFYRMKMKKKKKCKSDWCEHCFTDIPQWLQPLSLYLASGVVTCTCVAAEHTNTAYTGVGCWGRHATHAVNQVVRLSDSQTTQSLRLKTKPTMNVEEAEYPPIEWRQKERAVWPWLSVALTGIFYYKYKYEYID